MTQEQIRTVQVVQYLKPLREGGSMPGLVRADDDFLYVLKFSGAGQGTNALIGDLLGAELARAIGLKVPEVVFMLLDDSFSKTEPDEEIQDLLKFSVGLNLGMHFLSGAITYDPLVSTVDGLLASKVVLLDSMISNIDRTAKNANLLLWKNELWLIDHGSSFCFHHNWDTWQTHLERTFPLIKDHVLLSQTTDLEAAAQEIAAVLTEEKMHSIVQLIPEAWLAKPEGSISAADKRNAYLQFLLARLEKIQSLAKEAADAR